MSRKWERMVSKNSKQTNKRREKSGKKPIGDKDRMKFFGRGWILPTILVLVGLFYLIAFSSSAGDTIYWVTGFSYFLLAFIFFMRRPFLEVRRNELLFRRWNAIKTTTADEVEQIVLQDGYVVIVLKKNKTRWVLSRLIQRYNTQQIAEKLREFARMNSIAISDETKQIAS